MQIVINNCYGGFSISNEALHKLVDLNAKCITGISFTEFYKNTLSRKETEIKELEIKDWKLKSEGVWHHEYLGIAITNKDLVDQNNILLSTIYYLNRNEEFRTDPDLIKIIKLMGKNANGACADLKIIEIPNDIDWEIDEYDSIETIREKHRTWS